MKRFVLLFLVFAVIVGCAQQKAESSRAAIDMSKAMETVKEKTDYLIGQAKAFYNSKDFQNTIDIAQYVLQNLDKDSQTARDLIEKAKEQLQKIAQDAMGNMKNKLGDIGK